jgi:hypothetical protein
VSCTSATFCMAAGSDGHVDIWNGASWSAQPSARASPRSAPCRAPRCTRVRQPGPARPVTTPKAGTARPGHRRLLRLPPEEVRSQFRQSPARGRGRAKRSVITSATAPSSK